MIRMTREEAIKIIQELMTACTPDSKYYKVGQMAISALDNKTPCSLCRFVDDDSDLCDMCPAMPNERGAE